MISAKTKKTARHLVPFLERVNELCSGKFCEVSRINTKKPETKYLRAFSYCYKSKFL